MGANRSGSGLTGRERQVLELVERGLTNAEIARGLTLARPTVARLLSNAMLRLGAERRAQAVVLAARITNEGDRGHGGAVRHSLDPDELGILRLLGDGWRLGDVAAELGLSRRTADRRLATARRELGVERTVAAVARASQLGWLG